jgi:hypothetical protein
MSHHPNDGATSATATAHGGSDMRAAFTGLIVGTVALLAVVVGIVMLTNRKFEGHGEAPAPGAHGAVPPSTPH